MNGRKGECIVSPRGEKGRVNGGGEYNVNIPP